MLAPLIIGIALLGVFIFVEWKIVPLPLCVLRRNTHHFGSCTDQVSLSNAEFRVSASFSSSSFRICVPTLRRVHTVHIFRDATVSGAMIATFLSGMVFYAQLFFLPQYFQVVRGDSAIRSGILLLPLIVVQTVT